MYSVSSAFMTAVESNARKFYWTGTITTTDGTVYNFQNKDIVKGSGYITRSCCGSSEIELGTVYAAEMGISLFSNIDRYSLEDAIIRLYFNLYLADNSVETIPMGVFEVSEANRNAKTLDIKAYDYMLRFDKALTGDFSSAKPYNYLHVMCEECNVEMAQTQAEIEALPNGDAMFGIYADNDIDSYRDLLYYIGQVMGCVAQINRLGKLEMIPYENAPVATVARAHRFDSEYSDFVTRYTAVSSTNLITEKTEYYALETDNGLTMNLGINPLLQFGLVATRQRLLNKVLTAITKIEYVPFDAVTIGNPALDPMDVIKLTGGHADGNKLSCITGITYNINGKHKIKCVGKNPKLASAKSVSEKNISALVNQVEEKKTVVYDFVNTAPISVGTNPTEILSIDYVAKESTSAMFLAEVLLDVTAVDEVKSISGTATYTEESAEVQKSVTFNFTQKSHPEITVTYVLNNTEITNFKPKQICHEGKQILTLFLPLSNIIANSSNSFSVLLNMTNGSASIGEECVRGTISGQGLVAGVSNWNGRIVMNDKFGEISVGAFSGAAIDTITGSPVIVLPANRHTSLSSDFGEITVGTFTLISLDNFNELVTPGEVFKTATISTEFASQYSYNRIYIKTDDNQFALRTVYGYNGSVDTVDRGLITSVHLPFENFDSVEELEVTI